MSVLKKIGAILATVGADVSKFFNLPFVAQILGYLPTKLAGEVQTVVQKTEAVAGDLSKLSQFIVMAEAMYQAEVGQKTGSQKLQAAAPLIQNDIMVWAQSNLPGHSKIVTSPALFAQHCAAFTSALADILNDFGD